MEFVIEPIVVAKLEELHNAIRSYTQKINLGNVLVYNQYEKIVPINLWFNDSKYQVYDYFENEQHIRARYYNDFLLTPLVTKDNFDMGSLSGFRNSLSLYQPYYPETFFQCWDFLVTGLIGKSHSYLHIGYEFTLGTLEAIMLHQEYHNTQYLTNKYNCWVIGNEMRDPIDNSYRMVAPSVDYLGQTYPVSYMKSTLNLDKYDLITVDCGLLMDNVSDWSHQETDLHKTLFYVIYGTQFLHSGAKMLIKMRMLCTTGWLTLLQLLGNMFSEYEWFRSRVINPFNSEIYLFLNGYNPGKCASHINYLLLRNAYRYKLSKHMHIHCTTTNYNKLTQKFIVYVNDWAKQVMGSIRSSSIPEKNIQDSQKYILHWYRQVGIKCVSELTDGTISRIDEMHLRNKTRRVSPTICINSACQYPSDIDTLLKNKAELNQYKRVMDTKPSQIFAESKYSHDPNYSLITWDDLSNTINNNGDLKKTIRYKFGGEIVTNAWLKIYEILHLLPDMFTSHDDRIKSFHLCEAPGAFISGINHFVHVRKCSYWDWIAQSLRPSDPSALDDHYGLIGAYPNKWLWGPSSDKSGDITHSAVVRWYASEVSDVNFITADGGIRLDPAMINEQEIQMHKIIFGEAVTILSCLSKKGYAVIKMFLPMSEPLTISLMYLLAMHFEDVSVVKPESSHSDNSEIYVILRKYKGISPNVLETLYKIMDDLLNGNITPQHSLFVKIPDTFMRAYVDVMCNYMSQQISSLSYNYYFYYNFEKMNLASNKNISRRWLETYSIGYLDPEKKLIIN